MPKSKAGAEGVEGGEGEPAVPAVTIGRLGATAVSAPGPVPRLLVLKGKAVPP